MNLDERLQALTQSVELLARMQHDNELRDEKRFEQIARTFEVALDSIKRLENIAAAHEQRLDDLGN